MKTSEYTLKSEPEKVVLVPKHYTGHAKNLVNLALSANGEGKIDWADAMSRHQCLSDFNIFSNVKDLSAAKPGTEEYLKLQDRLYLIACLYGVSGSVNIDVQEYSKFPDYIKTLIDLSRDS